MVGGLWMRKDRNAAYTPDLVILDGDRGGEGALCGTFSSVFLLWMTRSKEKC